VVSAGIHRGLKGCDRIVPLNVLDAPEDRVTWIAAQTPWDGSALGTRCMKVCTPTPIKTSSLLSSLWTAATALPEKLLFSDHCDCRASVTLAGSYAAPAITSTSPTFLSVVPGSPQISCPATSNQSPCVGLYAVGAKYISAGMCGITSHPANPPSVWGTIYFALAAYMDDIWGADKATDMNPPYRGNDAIVTVTSCLKPFDHAWFAPTYKNHYYILLGNHLDGSAWDGDGKADSQRPVSWMAETISSMSFELTTRSDPSSLE